MASFINSRMGATGVICPKTFLLIQPSIGISLQWRAAGVFETLMNTLHEQVREQIKKNRGGQP
ncbi:MAG: hypothetical protein RMY27_32210 [Nostoc sp. DedQUE09]|nr:hypothetical protein [Nostoc sp. DedQUE09]MDZ7955685.1 hypothetical protein [Nostoc sp. DedQUE09]